MPDIFVDNFQYQNLTSNDNYCSNMGFKCKENGNVNGAMLSQDAVTAKREHELAGMIATKRHLSLIHI